MTLFEAQPAPPEGAVVRVKATIAYDGTGFHGFAAQPGNRRTVAGTLGAAIERVLGHQVDLTCAGRTDAGVHAWGQVVSFDASFDRFDPERLQRSVNKMLAPAIVVRSIGAAPSTDFDARYSARSRRYRYTILNDPVADPFLATSAWHVQHPLELRSLRLGCDPLIGEHDFSSFCRKPKDHPDEPLVRNVTDARWVAEEDGRILRFWIEANAFCHQMVRSVVGTLVDVGTGKRTAGELSGMLRARDRASAGPVAPPHGLCLWEVHYPE